MPGKLNNICFSGVHFSLLAFFVEMVIDLDAVIFMSNVEKLQWQFSLFSYFIKNNFKYMYVHLLAL